MFKKCFTELRRKRTFYVKYKEGRPTGLIASLKGTAFLNLFLEERLKG
jgi:hypothetical protein